MPCPPPSIDLFLSVYFKGAGLYHPGSVPTTTVPLPSAGGSTTPLLSGSSVASASAAGGVTPQERESFQQLLGQLDMEVHLEVCNYSSRYSERKEMKSILHAVGRSREL